MSFTIMMKLKSEAHFNHNPKTWRSKMWLILIIKLAHASSAAAWYIFSSKMKIISNGLENKRQHVCMQISRYVSSKYWPMCRVSYFNLKSKTPTAWPSLSRFPLCDITETDWSLLQTNGLMYVIHLSPTSLVSVILRTKYLEPKQNLHNVKENLNPTFPKPMNLEINWVFMTMTHDRLEPCVGRRGTLFTMYPIINLLHGHGVHQNC